VRLPSQSAERPDGQLAGFAPDQDIARSTTWTPPGKDFDRLATLEVGARLNVAVGDRRPPLSLRFTCHHPVRSASTLATSFVTLCEFKVLVRVVLAVLALVVGVARLPGSLPT
jgi:hypothetical protein